MYYEKRWSLRASLPRQFFGFRFPPSLFLPACISKQFGEFDIEALAPSNNRDRKSTLRSLISRSRHEVAQCIERFGEWDNYSPVEAGEKQSGC